METRDVLDIMDATKGKINDRIDDVVSAMNNNTMALCMSKNAIDDRIDDVVSVMNDNVHIMDRNFQAVSNAFGSVNAELNALRKRVKAVDTWATVAYVVGWIGLSIGVVSIGMICESDDRIDTLEAECRDLRSTMRDTDAELDALRMTVSAVENRVGTLSDKTTSALDALRAELNKGGRSNANA